MYSCKVTRNDIYSTESYTGLTAGTFKERFNGHNSDFRHKKQENNKKQCITMMSKYVWSLKHRNIGYRLEWKILGRAKSFNPISGKCRLCLLEKYFILFNPNDATLNSRHEIFIPCSVKILHILLKIT